MNSGTRLGIIDIAKAKGGLRSQIGDYPNSLFEIDVETSTSVLDKRTLEGRYEMRFYVSRS